MKRCLPICLAFLCLALPAASFGVENPRKVIVVLDASGSMWGQIGQRPKISIAKEVVRDIVKDWDQSIELGLTVYGHRQKGDCADIEAVVPLGTLNKSSFVTAVDGLTPKGKTPLTAAVEQAAAELRYEEDKATVILVSDGIETCDKDPCAAAKLLNEQGIDFTAHVIGFDISDESEIVGLKCIADNTGGKFLAASDAASLKSSLSEAVEEVAKAEPKEEPEEEKALPEERTIEFAAVHSEGGEPIEKVHWSIFKAVPADSTEQPKRLHATGKSVPEFSLPAGKYLVEVNSRHGQAKAEKEFEVTGGSKKVREEVIIPVEGILALSAVNEAGGIPLEKVHWELYEWQEEGSMEKPKRISSTGKAQPEMKLLPRKYLVKVKSSRGQAQAEKTVEVAPGKKNKEEVILAQEGIVQLVAVTEENGKPLEKVHWNLFEFADADSMNKPKRILSTGKFNPEFRLLPGKYTVEVKSRHGDAQAEETIEVIAGKKRKQEVLLPAEGIIKLKLTDEKNGKSVPGAYWQVFAESQNEMTAPKRVRSGGGAQPEYRLLPGKYTVKVVRIKGDEVDLSKEVEVVAGKVTKEEILLPTVE